MKAVIINLHGFNSGPGNKSEELQKQFPDCEVITPQLPYNPKEAISIIRGIVDRHIDSVVHIVGTSLGAFYTMYISTLYNTSNSIYYYLVNTSFEPHITLRRYEGKVVTNYKTGEKFETTAKFFHTLTIFYLRIKDYYDRDCIYASTYFIGTEDEVVDFTNFLDFIKSFKVPYKVVYSKQNHRFNDIADISKAIRYNSTLFI